MRLALSIPMRGAIVAVIPLLALVAAASARADDAHLVRIDFTANDRNAELVGTRFIAVEQRGASGPVVGGFTRSEIVCTAICSREVDRQWAFHVGGPGLTPSKQFLLPVGAGPLELRASTGSSTARDVGAIFTIAGVSLMATGAGTVGVHLLGRPIDADSTLRTMGLGLLGSGVLFLAIGLPMYAANGTSVMTFGAKPFALTPRGIVF
jgi:hypothetical protein